jgi:hypothetical protein
LELALEEVEGGVQPTQDMVVEHPAHGVEEDVAPHVDVRSYHPPS